MQPLATSDRPELDSAALIIVDMQRAFLAPHGGFQGHPERDDGLGALIEANRRAIDAMRQARRPVIWVRVEHAADLMDHAVSPVYVRDGVLTGPLCIAGTDGAEIVAGLDVASGDHTVIKKGHGAFIFTNLDRLLWSLRVHECLYAGGAIAGCISDTVHQGGARGYRQWLIEDALYPGGNESSIAVLAALAGRTTSRELAELCQRPRRPRSEVQDPGTAVLLLGIQNDFVHPDGRCSALPIEYATDYAASLEAYVNEARAQGWLVVEAPFVQRAHQLDSCAPPCWPAITNLACIDGEWGAQRADALSLPPADVTVRRFGPNAFAYTPLLRVLRRRGIDNLVIVGGDVRQSIDSTSRDAAAHGFRVTIVRDLTFPPADDDLDRLTNRAVVV